MNIIAVDPGKTGAVAYLGEAPASFKAIEVVDLGDAHQTVSALQEMSLYSPVSLLRAFVERAQAMPKQGVSSSFQTGVGFGLVVGALLAMGVPVEYVSPAKWKREMGLDRDKARSLDLARRLFPTAPLSLKKHHNRAEALLLAEWARRREGKNDAKT